jgi:hypothetical protein
MTPSRNKTAAKKPGKVQKRCPLGHPVVRVGLVGQKFASIGAFSGKTSGFRVKVVGSPA